MAARWDSAESAVTPDDLDRMTDAVRHRGPDGRGVYHRQWDDGGGVALGHRRLAIIDLEGGQQPLSNEDGTIWISFNGEIYNYEELRRDLIARGHQFRTHSDTETIVHLYEELGPECVRELRGMFALAIWDERERRLFFARDRLGEKPLVYHQTATRLLMGSEIKSLLTQAGVKREVDRESIARYLTYYYVPHPHTMFRGIKKLPPAHYGIYQQGKLQLVRYWQPSWNQESTLSVEAARERLAELLSESVREKLRSDVPLGAFLSGGIDSTVIVGLMQKHLTRPAKSYTIGFDRSQFDERPFARRAAEHLGTEHHEYLVAADSADILPRLVWHFDEPFGDSSAVPTWYVAQETRRHVTVALTGDGGDELFAGYPHYRTVERLGSFDRLPGWLRALIANRLWEWAPLGGSESSAWERLRRRMVMLREQPGRRYVNWMSPCPASHRRALLSREFAEEFARVDVAEPIARRFAESQGRSAGIQAMQTDLQSYLPDDLLAKVDITSMAHALECRAPFLDHRVVELALTFPFAFLTAGEGAKPMLTHSFPALVPADLRARPKAGFSVPLDDWFRGLLRPLAHDVLLSQTSLARGYFDPAAVRELLRQHDSGRWRHGSRIWALLFLELWHQQFVDRSSGVL
ncbi:MAG: asparagine synthase (glutamine-hydrolyzing) [Planctomycetota bacterium]